MNWPRTRAERIPQSGSPRMPKSSYDESRRVAGWRQYLDLRRILFPLGRAGAGEDYGAVGRGRIGRKLAEINATSLVEFGYFTQVANDERWTAPSRHPSITTWSMKAGNSRLQLYPAAEVNRPTAHGLVMEIYDPTFFSSLSPSIRRRSGCGSSAARRAAPRRFTRPSSSGDQGNREPAEAFFATLSAASDFGDQFANRALIACP